MRNRRILDLLCLSSISLSGCYTHAILHPVSGPPISEGYRAVIKPSGAFNSGPFYADLQEGRWFSNGECKGRWKAASPPKPLVANDMASLWDMVYGDGYYTTRILGAKQCARGSGICKKQGTVLDAEICQLEDGQNRKPTRVGVARDKDSVYKISFCLLDPCY